MNIYHIGTKHFHDNESGRYGTLIVRKRGNQVALGVIIEGENDMDILLNEDDVKSIIEILEDALNSSGN